MTNPKISVVMPVYNSADSIKRAINSILDQTFQDFEFLIVNEFGSDDGSREIIEQYVASDNRVKLIQLEKREGIGESLNIGIRAARGAYIARMDADDYSFPNRLEIQYAYMEKHENCVLCASAVRVINPLDMHGVGSSLKSKSDSDSIKADLLFDCVIWHPTVVFRRDVFVRNNWFYKDGYAEDFDLWTRVKGEMTNLPVTLLDYHVGETNTTMNYQKKIRDAFITICKRQFREKLQIDMEKYDDSLLWLKKEMSDVEDCILFLQNGYNFLTEIESKNLKLNEFSTTALTNAICKKWNYYVYITMHRIGLPRDAFSISLSDNSTGLFVSTMGQLLEATSKELPKKIEDIIYSYIGNFASSSRIVVFGCGKICFNYFEEFPDQLENVICFCDNDSSLYGGEFLGKQIICPSELCKLNFDIIVIASYKFFEEISDQLIKEYGIEQGRIIGLALLKWKGANMKPY